jgi:hypothetical protein
MKRSWKWAAFAAGISAVCAAFVTGRSWAYGIPATGALAYYGKLEAPNGDALTGTHNLEVKFWEAESGGTSPFCTKSQSVALDQGRFMLALPDTCTDAVQTNSDVWVEILVDGNSLGRTKAGAVPYAVEASHATNADKAGSADTIGTLAPSALQQRVTGSCSGANESLKSIAANGSVTCEADDDTTYTNGPGVSVGGGTISIDPAYVQLRVDPCTQPNQTIRSIGPDGTPFCVAPPVTSVEPGSGLSRTVNGGTVTLSVGTVTRNNISGSEVAVYEQAVGCGGGLTKNTTCTPLHCHSGGQTLFRDCDGTCGQPIAVPCTGLAPAGFLFSPTAQP